MGRGGDGLKRRGRAQTAQARTRGCREGLGTGMGQGGQEDRLAEADAAAGVRGSASAVGGGAHLLLVRAEQEDEQGLREALRERGGLRLRGNDTAHGEATGTWLRISKQFRKGYSPKFAGTAFSEVRRWPLSAPGQGLARREGVIVEAFVEMDLLYLQDVEVFAPEPGGTT